MRMRMSPFSPWVGAGSRLGCHLFAALMKVSIVLSSIACCAVGSFSICSIRPEFSGSAFCRVLLSSPPGRAIHRSRPPAPGQSGRPSRRSTSACRARNPRSAPESLFSRLLPDEDRGRLYGDHGIQGRKSRMADNAIRSTLNPRS
jgi:hypothetical protein